MSVTTPTRVRNRLGFQDINLTDAILQEYIDDFESWIVQEVGKTFPSSDPQFELARSVVTDGAAMYSIIRPAGGTAEGLKYKIDEVTIDKSTQLDLKLKTADDYIIQAEKGLATLKKSNAREDLPFSSDQVGF